MLSKKLRVGLGIDVHAFSSPDAGRALVIGGVNIPYDRGLAGHSDADVLIHAIMDALLSAARLPGAEDIGAVFPDTDPDFKDADSFILLQRVNILLLEAGFEVIDIDCVVVAQAPRLSPYREQMRENVAAALGIAVEQIGIKATTSEHLGFEGRGEGISAYSTVLLGKL